MICPACGYHYCPSCGRTGPRPWPPVRPLPWVYPRPWGGVTPYWNVSSAVDQGREVLNA